MATETARHLLSLIASATSIAGGGWIISTRRGCSQVRDVLGNGMTRANIGDTNIWGFAGFAESIVAWIEVLAFLDCDGRTVREPGKNTSLALNLLTFNLFWRRSFFVGILPYKRNRRCSSGLNDYMASIFRFHTNWVHWNTHTDIDLILLMRVHCGVWFREKMEGLNIKEEGRMLREREREGKVGG